MTLNPLSLIKCPAAMLVFIFGISVFALAAALIGQYVFGLEPCILCLYQRIPFIVAIILSSLGFGYIAIKKSKLADGESPCSIPPKPLFILIGLNGLAYFINAGIAFYHTGVEQRWWASAVEGCKVDFAALANSGSTQSLVDRIMSTPNVPCDEIPWVDPVLGLSMANYNIALGLGIALICGLSLISQSSNSASQ